MAKARASRWMQMYAVILTGIAALIAWGWPAAAVVWLVTSDLDSGAGSLRQAIAEAASGDEIEFDLAAGNRIVLTSGQIAINKDLRIVALAESRVVVDGNGNSRIFDIGAGTVEFVHLDLINGREASGGGIYNNGGQLTLSDCTVSGNTATESGGGILSNGGRLVLDSCTVANNTAASGGGIASEGTASLTACTVRNNTAESSGGGIDNCDTIQLTNCTISGNTAWNGFGGGIFNDAGTVTVSNCTISGNMAMAWFGGGISNDTGTVTVSNCTITGNLADRGGGIFNVPGGTSFGDSHAVTMANSILCDNFTQAGGQNFHGTLTSAGYNLIHKDVETTVIGDTSGDLYGGTPNLGPLADNGGPTHTHALLEGSVALDAIPEGGNSYNGAPVVDQRGEARPSPLDGNCDIGAFEYQHPASPEMAVSGLGVAIPSSNAEPRTDNGTDFSSAPVGVDTIDRTFTITNSGTAELELTGGERVEVLGEAAVDFTVIDQPTTPVLSNGGTTTFTIRFKPTVIGTRNATLRIDNTDSDENPYEFLIRGEGQDPGDSEIDVSGQGITIPCDDTEPQVEDGTDFGSVLVHGDPVDCTFTITNSGTAALALTGTPTVQVRGDDAGDFTVIDPPTTPVTGGGGTTTFTIRFAPTAPGARAATVHIDCTDADESPYEFAIQGVGTGIPRPSGGSGSGGNLAPVPNAGPGQSVCMGERVVLDGSRSYDPDTGIPPAIAPGHTSSEDAPQQPGTLQFRWAVAILYFSAGRPVYAAPEGIDIQGAIQEADSAIASFAPTVPGIYQFDLFVTDEYGDTLSDRVTITCLLCGVPADSEPREGVFERFVVYPNPFEDQVRFTFAGEGVADVITVAVFDLSGCRVWQGEATDSIELLWDGQATDGTPLALGAYPYSITLTMGAQVHTQTGVLFLQQ